jgi:hypothetical protein
VNTWLISGSFIAVTAITVTTMWMITCGSIIYRIVTWKPPQKAAQVTPSPPSVIEINDGWDWEWDVTCPGFVPGAE